MRNLQTVRRFSARAGAFACLVALAACTKAAPSTGMTPSTGPSADVRVNTSRGTSATDENIKMGPRANTRDAAGNTEGMPAAKATGGATTRGNYACTVHFDNRSDLVIQTYVDGNYAGILGRYGDLYTYAVPGPTRLYARADYTDGSYDTWGPTVVDCPDGGSFTWRLRHSSR
jgi:hypothetical protein